MEEFSENEKKLSNFIKQDKINIVNKLCSFDKIKNFDDYLKSHDIYFANEELNKLFIIFQYFGKNTEEDNNNNEDDDNNLDISGGKSEENLIRNSGIGKDLYEHGILNTESKFFRTKV